MKDRVIPPHAHNSLNGFNRMEYDLKSAVSDIIDNSIAAKSSRIDILHHSTPFEIGIVDNGTGMDFETLEQALTFGSKDPESDDRASNDLGRYGLGLNLASINVCRRVTVISKQNGYTHGLQLDLDYIQGGSWTYRELEDQDISDTPFVDNLKDSGTLVLWQNMSLNLPDPSQGKMYGNQINQELTEVREHIGLVFQRFIEGYQDIPKCVITLNNAEIPSFDPFFEERSTKTPSEPEFFNSDIKFQAFTLPHESTVSAEEWKYYGFGKSEYLANQGVYLYRANRLIIWGNWLTSKVSRRERSKLCRVKIDIPNTRDSDEKWRIHVSKSKAIMPIDFSNRLVPLIPELQRSSEETLGKKGVQLINTLMPDTKPLWSLSSLNGVKNIGINAENPILKTYIENKQIDKIISFISNNLPKQMIYEIMMRPESDGMGQIQESDSEALTNLKEQILIVWASLTNNSDEYSADIGIHALKQYDSFVQNWSYVLKILSEEGVDTDGYE